MATRLGMDAGAATRLLDRMQAKGMCERSRSRIDRRVVRVRLGELGLLALERTDGLVERVFAEQFENATRQELDALEAVLTRLVSRCAQRTSEPGNPGMPR
jgi:DNA-binding MarR family transcriptional regulator